MVTATFKSPCIKWKDLWLVLKVTYQERTKRVQLGTGNPTPKMFLPKRCREDIHCSTLPRIGNPVPKMFPKNTGKMFMVAPYSVIQSTTVNKAPVSSEKRWDFKSI